MAAGLQIERMLGTKSWLDLYVRAEPGWRDSRAFVEELDGAAKSSSGCWWQDSEHSSAMR